MLPNGPARHARRQLQAHRSNVWVKLMIDQIIYGVRGLDLSARDQIHDQPSAMLDWAGQGVYQAGLGIRGAAWWLPLGNLDV